MPASVPPHQALPVHVDAKRARMDAESAAELNKLLKPNELRTFVEQHSEFAWEPNGNKGMIIKWG